MDGNLVFGVYVSQRVYDIVLAIADYPRNARPRFGGEWAVGAVLMGETIRANTVAKQLHGAERLGNRLGRGGDLLHGAVQDFPAGDSLARHVLDRILPAFLVFYIRRFVPEPDVFAKTKKQMEAKGESSHFLEIFSPACSAPHC